ncbi:unnamed protein product [Mycetohabitans rhizoxinica HKI 454]|uniref:Uncharacterized protein n=1 Tax=Mycetohabitans rhizoxinica (strain DSM 19002 / CIP 109453 / HKI 454) TaxID=882378 RepID=E5ALC8_MYCRK|nr:unnamed protein product [Mycetohabitans rhizoxinica HKI 454]
MLALATLLASRVAGRARWPAVSYLRRSDEVPPR